MGKAIVLIPPARGGQQHVETGNSGAPGQRRSLLQPFAVLHRLGGADHSERLICRKQAVPPGERVALKPAVAVVLGQHFHNSAVM